MLKLVPIGIFATALAVGAAAAGAPATSTSTYTYRATMTTAAEVPKPSATARARGNFAATVTENGTTRSIRWTLTFRSLSGKAVAAHVHRGKPGVAGAVLLGLCGPCKTGQSGRTAISTAVANALEQGRAYVNVHTAKNPGGEVRGQVKLTKTVEGTGGAQTTPDPAPAPAPDPGSDGGKGEY